MENDLFGGFTTIGNTHTPVDDDGLPSFSVGSESYIDGMSLTTDQDRNLSAGNENLSTAPEASPVSGNNPLIHPSADPGDPLAFQVDEKTARRYPPVPIIFKQRHDGMKEYTVYFSGPIKVYDDYFDLINRLNIADSETVFVLKIDSGGGSIDIARTIASAIMRTKAHVIGDCVGMAASAAMYLWSVCHEQRATKKSIFMFHMSLHSDWGNSMAVKNRAEGIIQMVLDYLLKVSLDKGHLLQEELDRILERNDNIWISGEVMLGRINQAA